MTTFRFHPSVPLHFVVLWLMIIHIPFAKGVCHNCFGAAQGCGGETGACPWVIGVAANVAAIGAASGGALTLLALLPSKIVRLFPKAALDVLSSVAARDPTNSFDPDGKTATEIVNAVKFGHFSKVDAILHFTEEIGEVDDNDDQAGIKIKKLEAAIKSVESVTGSSAVSPGINEGCLLYILSRLSKTICNTQNGATSFDLCVDVDGKEGDSTKGSQSFSATLSRPQSFEQLVSLLNLYVMVSHAVGAANVIGMTTFLDEVVYEPVRMGVLPWPIAFECMILYLRMLETHGSTYILSTIVHACGGIDAIRLEASSIAHQRYNSAFFRTLGGKPGIVKTPLDGSTTFDGKVKGDNPTSTKPCASWNLDKKHLARHVDSDGKCRFKHGMCDQYVTDKGPSGICGGHKQTQPNPQPNPSNHLAG